MDGNEMGLREIKTQTEYIAIITSSSICIYELLLLHTKFERPIVFVCAANAAIILKNNGVKCAFLQSINRIII